MSSSRTPRSRSPRPAAVRGVFVVAAGGPGAGTPIFVEVLPPLPAVPPQEEPGQNLYLSLVALRGSDTLRGMKTTTRTAPAAILYCRVSSKEQGRSGLGIEAQEAACRQSAAEAGLRVVDVVREVESGGNDDRTGLQQALASVVRTRGVLVVAKLDRLSRSLAKTATILRDHGDRVRVADCPQAGQFELGLRAVLAQEERRLGGERTRAALAAAKARGVRLGSNRPGHWKGREDRRVLGARRGAAAAAAARLEASAPVRDAARPIVEAHPGASLRELAELLQQAGVRTPQGHEVWTPTGVARLRKVLRRQK